MTDIRIYCSEDYKKKIKILAINKGITVSEMLTEIIDKAIPQENQCDSLQSEIENINFTLATNGGKMTADERQVLKDRRNEIKKYIQKGE